MPNATSSVWVLALSVLSAVLLTAVWKCTNRGSQTPFWIFIGVYFVTTFLGGLSIGLQGLDYFESIVEGINLSILYDIGSAKYWCILFGPLIVPPACVLALNLGKRRMKTVRRVGPPRVQRVSVLVFMLVVLLFGGYSVYEMYRNGFLFSINLWQVEQGNFHTLMTYRSDMMLSLGSAHYIIAYSLLPTLCSYALYEAVKSRSLVWLIAFAISFGLAAFLVLSTLQKSYLLINILSLGIGLVTLKVIKTRSFGFFVAVSFGLLTVMQTFIIGQWHLLDTARHLVFRMSSAYPFYINIYPTHLPFEGIYLGLNLFGIGKASQVSVDVIHCMYTNLGADLANAPAAAHIDAYAQGGVVYSFAILVVIGVLLGKIGTLRFDHRGPIAFAFYIQILVFAYYLSQGSFVVSIVGSFGIAWPVVALAPIWFMQKFVASYARRPGVSPSRSRRRQGTTPAHSATIG